METTWFAIGLIGVALGAVAFAALGPGLAHDNRHHATIHFFVAATASLADTAMLMGQGKLAGEEGHPFYDARYVDWSITTPLLLLGLALVAVHGRAKERFTLLGGLIGADLMMIVTGLFAGLSDDWRTYVWCAISSGAFLAVLWLLWFPVRTRAEAQDADRAALSRRLTGALTLLWFGYPIVWLFGTQSTATLGGGTETMLHAILDVVAKTGFGLLLLAGVRSLEGRETAPEERVVREQIRQPA